MLPEDETLLSLRGEATLDLPGDCVMISAPWSTRALACSLKFSFWLSICSRKAKNLMHYIFSSFSLQIIIWVSFCLFLRTFKRIEASSVPRRIETEDFFTLFNASLAHYVTSSLTICPYYALMSTTTVLSCMNVTDILWASWFVSEICIFKCLWGWPYFQDVFLMFHTVVLILWDIHTIKYYYIMPVLYRGPKQGFYLDGKPVHKLQEVSL